MVKETLVAALAEAFPVTPLAVMPQAGDVGSDAGGAVHEAVRRYTARAPGDRGAQWGRTGESHRATARAGISEAPTELAAEPGVVAAEAPLFTGPVVLAHYRQSYIIAQDEEGLLLIDQHAAHERILFEQLAASAAGGEEGERQDLLFPVTIVPPRRLGKDLAALAAELESLGFASEPFGEGTLVVRSVPASLEGRDPAPLLEELLDSMDEEDPPAVETLSRRERLLATVACHAAIKVRMALTPEKMNYLISALFRTRSPLKCPHGRPAVVRLAHQKIERSFDRP